MTDVSNKSEKLASALYLITSFFADQEPMKWKLRSLASDLISISTYTGGSHLHGNSQSTLELRNIVLEIRNLMLVAKNAGLISDANHTLLDQEFEKYLSLLNLPLGLSEKSGQAVLSESFFIGTETEGEKPKIRENQEKILLKDKNNSVLETSKNRELLDISEYMAKGHKSLDKGYNELEHDEGKTKSLKEYGAVSVKKNSRQSVIIGILKRKKEIMIKDVSSLISGCSEKTIQRELLAMVKSGVLKKVGEKRWSRYTLA